MASIKLISWNMEWMNDLFDKDGEIKPLHETAYHSNTTVGNRIEHLTKVIHELDPDIVIIVEGPNRTGELQKFFDIFVNGDWKTHIQQTSGSSQCNGIAVRTDLNKFDSTDALKITDTSQTPAFQPFFSDSEEDGIKEQYHFERFPLLARIKTSTGKQFNILGLHLKSKGIFTAYEWSKWWLMADANRKKILAQCSQIRLHYLNEYLSEPETMNVPLIVCGDINDGPGMDASERRLLGSGVERLMGSVWHPELCLKNALFEYKLKKEEQFKLKFEKISTTSFKDPIFNGVYHKSWIDHILYSSSLNSHVVSADVHYELAEGKIWEEPYRHASDHYPISLDFDIDS